MDFLYISAKQKRFLFYQSQIMKNFIYPLSLVAFAICLLLIIQYPYSGRMNMIAGGLATIGCVLNIIGYVLAKRSRSAV